jgi:hypothetical protein
MSITLARKAIVALATAAILTLAMVPGASAEITHRFLKNMALPVSGGVQPVGVDAQGDIIVLTEGTIRKFSSTGEPVDFSALGTNVIDGAGGGNCPATPADCDQTPWNSLGPATLADMNQSQTGPTAGYIYVAAIAEPEPGAQRSQIVVFDSTGTYRGQIDTSLPTPWQSPEGVPTYLSVSPSGGSVVITYDDTNVGDDYHADKYQTLDEDPAHDAFAGQLRRTYTGSPYEFQLGTVADDNVVYVGRGQGWQPKWQLYEAAAFGRTVGDAVPVNFDPGKCECAAAGPWGDGGQDEEVGYIFEGAAIDPSDHHAYLIDYGFGRVEEWATPTEKVGPTFGNGETLGGANREIAFDTSGIASTDGRIYFGRGNSLVVYSPPVPMAEIHGLQASVGHSSADVSATIDLAHGPKVTDCLVQWGEEQPEQTPSYPQSAPCEPTAPYTGDVTPIDTHISGLTTEKTYLVRIVIKSNNGVNRSVPIRVRPVGVLSVETGPATGVTRTSAQLNGSLDPDGIATTYWFRYGIDTQYRQQTPHAAVPNGTGVVPVAPVEIGNLQSGRRYHFQLVAENELGTTFGPDETFVAASAPAISGVQPTDVAETSATLNARINPGGSATTYRFQYGTSTAYGQETPLGGEGIGAGTDPVPVRTHLTGLEPGVTYHFRVAAENAWGTETTEDSTFNFFPESCPNAYVRQLTRAAYLPDCRAYELVSPGSAGAVRLYPGDVTQDLFFYNFGIGHLKTEAMNLGSATGPARFSYLGLAGALEGTNPPNSLIDTYTATRTASGWVSNYWGQRGDETFMAGGARCDLAMDTCIDYRVRDLFFGGNPDPTSRAPFVWDAEGHSLGRWPTNVNVVPEGTKYIGDDEPSADFKHYVFSSVNVPFTVDGVTGAPGSAYDNDVENAKVTKISVLPSGFDIPPGQTSEGSTEEFIKIAAVSTDGSHILMTTQGAGGQNRVNLYMRVNDAVTYPIASGKEGIRFLGMTSDGSKVVFLSPDHVTPDDTDDPSSNDLYLWEEKTNEITRISQGNGTGNSDECQPAEGSLCSVTPLETERPDSDDPIASSSGDVYFYSPEQLDPNSPGVPNEKNLYVYRHGAVKYVATLDPGTAINRIQISPDGSHVALLTASRLTSYDNQGWREMYTFNPETGVIRCASCIPTGEPPTVLRPPEEIGNSSNPARLQPSKDVMASQSGRFMADDGRTVFATSDALVESDTDGLVDVYEFAGGRPNLISSGTAHSDHLVGNRFYPGEYTGVEAISHGGSDIYFSTYDTLAPTEDRNGEFLKFYDARTNGGFVPPPADLPCVAADECHGPENAGPAPSVVGTGAALPASQKAQTRKQHRKPHRHHKKRKKSQHRAHAGRARGHRHG